MASPYEARLFISDENGEGVSGGKARFRDANTTNLTPLFSDATLSTPLANPVVADGNGWTPQIFGAEGTVCDLQYLTAADVAIPSRNYVDVVFLGSDASGATRTFSGGTRYKLSDSGGVVIAEYGDPSPDNVGGSSTEQGWAGTQGDNKVLNFASVNAGTSAGALKENSKRLQGVVATDATTLAAATTNIIPLPNSPAGCRAWKVDFFDMTRSAGTSIVITLQLSFDGGVTYKSTNEYDWYIWSRSQSGANFVEGVGSATSSIEISDSIRGSSNKLIWGSLEILSPLSSSSSDATIVKAMVVGMNMEATNKAVMHQSVGYCQSASQGRPTHVKLLANSGNIDCKYRVVPLRGFGET